MSAPRRAPDAAAITATVRAGGVIVFPADTVYGLGCDPDDAAAVSRLYALKQRPPDKSAAVMFFSVEAALVAIPELAPFRALVPGGVTLLLPNPAGRYPFACRADPMVLGVRVVAVAAMSGVDVPVLQSSANLAGGPDARRLDQVEPSITDGAELVIDGGELPGVSSTVVDLRRFAADGSWRIVRDGAVPRAAVVAALGGDRHSRC